MRGKLQNIIISKILSYLNNAGFTEKDGLPYLRSKIFNGFMLVLMAFSTLAIIPNLIASVSAKTHLITITDILIFLVMIFVFTNKKVKLRTRTIIILSVVYLLSLVLLIMLGPMGPGFIWLASVSLIAALFIGLTASIVTILINLAIIVILAVFIKFNILNTIFFESYNVVSWTAISSNVLIFNSITSIPLALLINALERSLMNEKALKLELLERNKTIEVEKIRAEESDKLKSAFLANLSHEIRTPMNAIIGFSELIQNNLQEEQILKYSKQVTQNADYLLHLINDIVDISIIESGQLRFVYHEFKLNDLIDQLIPIIRESNAQKKHPNTRTEFILKPEVKDLVLESDGTRLKQILINLISNAIKYTPSGFVRIIIEINNTNLLFSVIDSGVGIPEKEQNKIYQRFSKIERNGKYSVPGIGLGLSITKGLVEGLGGKIWFESKENEGTGFYFTLPLIANNLKNKSASMNIFNLN